MSTVSRGIQTVKPHIPLIKFRKGQGSTGKVVEMVKAATSHNPLASQPNQSSSSNLPKVGNTPRGSAVIQDLDLPTRYHRKLISEEEIAFIERGGPE